ncbi:D-tyrosyl-tRNA(Tyr) deacylase [Croceifilum oryzae]|uniref:D-aminoacyl-tRNA deacylase n=1 Tax=Croceifilum oryzae TaxID=1553429 RepID=A0AAJ1TFV8_9BACL|nr:D-aminoacyl-tRNA deacylase [Croceifilum oryzae]MDQ0417764.1 D-tyrosyl-tRNA(Tyr) deacylase [Croceifilum oryzae]
MRVVIQRVSEASVTVDEQIVGAINQGLLLLVGITENDGEEEVQTLAEKVVHLRIFEDEEGKMNKSLLDLGGAILSVSQFTLYGDCRKGRRPSFMAAARPELAQPLYERFNEQLRHFGVEVQTGIFGAMMDVSLHNDGPVTILLDSQDLVKKKFS